MVSNELLNIIIPLEINERLCIYDVDQVNIKEMVEALKWQLPYYTWMVT